MRTNIYKIAVFLLLIALLVPTLSGCGARESDEDLLQIATEKLEASIEINKICFAEGFTSEGVGGYVYLNYIEVSRAEQQRLGVTSTAELKALIAEVYSEDICFYIDELVFGGQDGSNKRYIDVTDDLLHKTYLLVNTSFIPKIGRAHV